MIAGQSKSHRWLIIPSEYLFRIIYVTIKGIHAHICVRTGKLFVIITHRNAITNAAIRQELLRRLDSEVISQMETPINIVLVVVMRASPPKRYKI